MNKLILVYSVKEDGMLYIECIIFDLRYWKTKEACKKVSDKH